MNLGFLWIGGPGKFAGNPLIDPWNTTLPITLKGLNIPVVVILLKILEVGLSEGAYRAIHMNTTGSSWRS